MTGSPRPCTQCGCYGMSWLLHSNHIPLLEGRHQRSFRCEVLPQVPDIWIDDSSTKIGCDVFFNRYFYEPVPRRPLVEIPIDIEALERKTDDWVEQILVGLKERA